MDFSNMNLAEILRTYSLVKGHRTRCEREIQSLLEMLKVQYSAPSEVRVNDRLEKLEKHTHKLSDITDYLITAKYAKAGDHSDEVAEFFTTLDEAFTQVFKVIHERHAAAPQAAAVAAIPAPARTSKPSAELKPKELLHDASMATFRTWKKTVPCILRRWRPHLSSLFATTGLSEQLYRRNPRNQGG